MRVRLASTKFARESSKALGLARDPIGVVMLKDFRYAVRMLLQAKGWTIVVLVCLALGIGANTAIFSLLNGLLLTRIPVAEPETLVRLRWNGRNDMVTSSSDYGFIARGPGWENGRATFSYPMYQQFL